MSSSTPPREPRILVVCAGNTCRSPMAAAVLRQALEPDVTVESAGVAARGEPAAGHAVTALRGRGIDLRHHRSRHVDSIDLRGFDLVIAMSEGIAADLRGRGVQAERLLVWPVKDPIGGALDDYRMALASIDRQFADEPRLSALRARGPR